MTTRCSHLALRIQPPYTRNSIINLLSGQTKSARRLLLQSAAQTRARCPKSAISLGGFRYEVMDYACARPGDASSLRCRRPRAERSHDVESLGESGHRA